MRQHDGVEEDDLAGHHHVAAQHRDGGVQLPAGVEQWVVLHLGEGPGPGPVPQHGVPAEDAVPVLRDAEHDALVHARPRPHALVAPDTDGRPSTALGSTVAVSWMNTSR